MLMPTTNMASNNMYRVGDFVYFEASASAPYQIRKIEELNKTSIGAVEAKVVCFYRRRDLPANLTNLADKHQKDDLLSAGEELSSEQLRQIKHREVFISRHLETLPATHIRGKCAVALHSEADSCLPYLESLDSFFFRLVYNPIQKTLQADKGTIRVGDDYQVAVPLKTIVEDPSVSTERQREQEMWSPTGYPSGLDLDSYLVLARSLATLARAYHPPSALRQPSLLMSAAAASRDTTQQQALDVLHSANYDITRALQLLVPEGQPLLKLDEMEEWSTSEGNLFEEALEKYGKCFYDIHSDFLPWKSPKNLVAFYYMWKTTDHCVQQKRMKAAEAEQTLQQVYIPNYNKPNPAVLFPPKGMSTAEQAPSTCESCSSPTSHQWYALSCAANILKICSTCWAYWKRYGDLKCLALSEKLRQVANVTSGYKGSPKRHDQSADQKGNLTNHIPTKSYTNSTLLPTIPSAATAVTAETLTSTHMSPNHQLRPITDRSHSMSNGSQAFDTASAQLKSRISGSFFFQSSAALRIARRLFLDKKVKPKRQARQPFTKSKLAVQVLQSEAEPLLRGLSATEAKRLSNFCRRRSVHTLAISQSPLSTPLKAAALRLQVILDGISLSCKTKKVRAISNEGPAVILSTNNDFCVATAEDKSHSSRSGAGYRVSVAKQKLAITASLKRSRPESVNNLDDSDPTPHKRNNDSVDVDALNVTGSASPASPAPKRRTGADAGGLGPGTLMFLAADTFKRCRRKLITSSTLRRLCRKPLEGDALRLEEQNKLDLEKLSSETEVKKSEKTSSMIEISKGDASEKSPIDGANHVLA